MKPSRRFMTAAIWPISSSVFCSTRVLKSPRRARCTASSTELAVSEMGRSRRRSRTNEQQGEKGHCPDDAGDGVQRLLLHGVQGHGHGHRAEDRAFLHLVALQAVGIALGPGDVGNGAAEQGFAIRTRTPRSGACPRSAHPVRCHRPGSPGSGPCRTASGLRGSAPHRPI